MLASLHNVIIVTILMIVLLPGLERNLYLVLTSKFLIRHPQGVNLLSKDYISKQ